MAVTGPQKARLEKKAPAVALAKADMGSCWAVVTGRLGRDREERKESP